MLLYKRYVFVSSFCCTGIDLAIRQFQHDLEKDEEEFEFTDKDDVYAIASLLKVGACDKFVAQSVLK
jgi:hypothetical protein